MSRIFLKLNTDKTGILIVSPKNQWQQIHLHLKSISVKCSEQVRNLDIIFDTDQSFENHITNITRTAFDHLKNIHTLIIHVSNWRREISPCIHFNQVRLL